MTDRERTLSLGDKLATETDALRSGPAIPASAWNELWLAEAHGSLAFSGLRFVPVEIAKLLAGGLVPAGRTLDDCNAVADYGAAAAHVRTIGRPRPHRALLRLEEVVGLHALVTRRSSGERPGKWRTGTAPPLASGVVPPPAWLVPRDMSAFVERFERGPGAGSSSLYWLADCHERFTRIHPYASANGRVARLIVNLLLLRLAFPPVVLRRSELKKFAFALDRAGAGDLWPSALLLGRNLQATVRSLDYSRSRPAEGLVPIGLLAAAEDRGALFKAAQRGRLRSVRKGTRIFTSKRWLDEYLKSRAAAGRPPLSKCGDKDEGRSAFSL